VVPEHTGQINVTRNLPVPENSNAIDYIDGSSNAPVQSTSVTTGVRPTLACSPGCSCAFGGSKCSDAHAYEYSNAYAYDRDKGVAPLPQYQQWDFGLAGPLCSPGCECVFGGKCYDSQSCVDNQCDATPCLLMPTQPQQPQQPQQPTQPIQPTQSAQPTQPTQSAQPTLACSPGCSCTFGGSKCSDAYAYECSDAYAYDRNNGVAPVPQYQQWNFGLAGPLCSPGCECVFGGKCHDSQSHEATPCLAMPTPPTQPTQPPRLDLRNTSTPHTYSPHLDQYQPETELFGLLGHGTLTPPERIIPTPECSPNCSCQLGGSRCMDAQRYIHK